MEVKKIFEYHVELNESLPVVIFDTALNESRLLEYNLSRAIKHTADDVDFAIIGSRDKDTGEDRSAELKKIIADMQVKEKLPIGYKNIRGKYTYKQGPRQGKTEEIDEYSAQIFRIDKQKALDIGRELNQESIIWKDNDFFGMIDPATGNKISEFKRNDLLLDRNDDLDYSSSISNNNADKLKHNKNTSFAYKEL